MKNILHFLICLAVVLIFFYVIPAIIYAKHDKRFDKCVENHGRMVYIDHKYLCLKEDAIIDLK